MPDIHLSCFLEFTCLAGDCPDTCCSGWQVDLDDNTAKKYIALDGPLGDELRDRLIKTPEGYSFSMNGLRCPFLNEGKLCRLILAEGENILSTTCREHPRFWEEFKDRREHVLSISCPEAARLLFAGDLTMVERPNREPLPDCDYDEELFSLLYELRQDYFSLLQSQEDLTAICTDLLAEAEDIQRQCDLWFDLPKGNRYTGSTAGYLEHLKTIRFTDDRLPCKLEKRKQENTLLNMYPEPARRLLYYFLYRYLLTAVWDGQVLEKVLFCLYSVRAIYALAESRQDIQDAAILYSREVEHSPENLAGIFAFLYEQSL